MSTSSKHVGIALLLPILVASSLAMTEASPPGSSPAPSASPEPDYLSRGLLGSSIYQPMDPRLIPGYVAPVRANARYVLHVDRTAGSTRAWAEETCVWLHNLIVLERKNPVETDCVSSAIDTEANARIFTAKTGRDHQYGIYFTEDEHQNISLRIENWLRSGETDFDTAQWKIESTRGVEVRNTALQAKLRSFFQFDNNRRLLGEYLLSQGSRFSETIALTLDGQYVDKNTRRPLSYHQAFERFRDESSKQKHFLRASFEIAALLGLGAIGYWNSPSIQDRETNDYMASMRVRFTSMDLVRMDDNDFRINQLGHPISGYFYYGAARANGFNSLESLAMSFVASTFWEYIVEGLEVVSINDIIVTPMAGIAIGEVFHQLRNEFTRRGSGLMNRVLRGVFGAPEGMDAWVRKHMIKSDPLAGIDFNQEAFANFQVFTEVRTTRGEAGAQQDVEIGTDMEVLNIPAHNRPGRQRVFLRGTPYSRMLFKTSVGSAGFNDLTWLLQTALAGYYRKNITETSEGRLRGYSYLVGIGTSFHYEELDSVNAKDQLGIVNVLGPMLDATLFYKGAVIRIKMDLFGDFATVRGIAVDDYVAGGGTLTDTKEIMRKRGYYYAFGVSSSSRVEMTRGRFNLGAESTFRYYNSIEGMDLRQSRVTNDFNIVDRRGSFRAWTGYTFPKDRLRLELGVSGNTWSGQAATTKTVVRTHSAFSRFRIFF